MSSSQGWLAQFLLRYASPLAGLRSVPVLGQCVSWAGEKLVPRDSLAWVQVQNGPAKGLWLHLNPRTGKTYFEGSGEPEVQQVLEQHLRAGMTFYDIGANIGLFSLLAARLVGKEGRVVSFEADPKLPRDCASTSSEMPLDRSRLSTRPSGRNRERFFSREPTQRHHPIEGLGTSFPPAHATPFR